jgi:hypothetical protein
MLTVALNLAYCDYHTVMKTVLPFLLFIMIPCLSHLLRNNSVRAFHTAYKLDITFWLGFVLAVAVANFVYVVLRVSVYYMGW